MKRIAITIFILFALTYNVLAVKEVYDINTMAVYTLNNTRVDATGNFSPLTSLGAVSFVTDKVNKSPYSHQVTSTINALKFPADLVNALATKTQFTISGWFATIDVNLRIWYPMLEALRHDTMPVDRANPMFGFTVFPNQNLSPDGKTMIIYGVHGSTRGNTYTYPNTLGWVRLNFEWTGTEYRLFLNGILIYTYSSSINVFVDMPAANYPGIGHETYFNTYSDKGRYDYFVISDTLRNGADVEPIIVQEIQYFKDEDMKYFKLNDMNSN